MMVYGRCLSKVDSTSVSACIKSLDPSHFQYSRTCWYSEMSSISKCFFIWPKIGRWWWLWWNGIWVVDIVISTLYYHVWLILFNWDNTLSWIIAEIWKKKELKSFEYYDTSQSKINLKGHNLLWKITCILEFQSLFCTTKLDRHYLLWLVLLCRMEALQSLLPQS